MTLKNILGLSLILLVLSACHKEKDPSSLIVGVSAEYPPFEFQENGQFKGFDIDLVNLLGQKLKKKIVFKELPFRSLIAALKSNKIEIIASAMTATPERKQILDFTEAYYSPKLALIYHKDLPLKVEALQGKVVGVQTGSLMEEYLKSLKDKFPDLAIKNMDMNPALIQELLLKRISGVLVEEAQAYNFCQNNPTLGFMVIPGQAFGYAIALNKNSLLLKDLNQTLQAIKDSGELAALEAKWFPKQ